MSMDLLVIVRVALILSCLIVVIQMVKVNHVIGIWKLL